MKKSTTLSMQSVVLALLFIPVQFASSQMGPYGGPPMGGSQQDGRPPMMTLYGGPPTPPPPPPPMMLPMGGPPMDGLGSKGPKGGPPKGGQGSKGPKGGPPMDGPGSKGPKGGPPMSGPGSKGPKGGPPMSGPGSKGPKGGPPMDGLGSKGPKGGPPMSGPGSKGPKGGPPKGGQGSKGPKGGPPMDGPGSKGPKGGPPKGGQGSKGPKGGPPMSGPGSKGPKGRSPDMSANVQVGQGSIASYYCPPRPPVIDPSFDTSTEAVAQSFTTITSVAGMVVNGAHHRTLIDQASYTQSENGFFGWATGDFASDSESESLQASGEIGMSWNAGLDDVRFGLGLGYAYLSQDLPFSGDHEAHGQYAIAEFDWSTQYNGQEIILSALGYYGRSDSDITRGYLTGGLADSSAASTNTNIGALRLRADLVDLYEFHGWKFSPRFAYTLIYVQTNGYTETGGGAPATFDQYDSFNHEVRIGLDADYRFNTRAEVRLMAEVVASFDGNDQLTGTNIAGAFNTALPDQNYVSGRIGVELVYQLTESQTISTAVFGSTEGNDNTVSGAISYGFAF